MGQGLLKIMSTKESKLPTRSYSTSIWQSLALSLLVSLVLNIWVDSIIIWFFPLLVLCLVTPYILRVYDIITDVRKKRKKKRLLRLLDISEEFTFALHRDRTLRHWTLIFEDVNEHDNFVVLSAAMTMKQREKELTEKKLYIVTNLEKSKVIVAMHEFDRKNQKFNIKGSNLYESKGNE